jgi:hypothetical protein
MVDEITEVVVVLVALGAVGLAGFAAHGARAGLGRQRALDERAAAQGDRERSEEVEAGEREHERSCDGASHGEGPSAGWFEGVMT